MGLTIGFQRLDDIPNECVEKQYPVKIRIIPGTEMYTWQVIAFQEHGIIELVPIAKATVSGQSCNHHDMYSLIISCLIVDGFNVTKYPAALISNHDIQTEGTL